MGRLKVGFEVVKLDDTSVVERLVDRKLVG